jgi:5-methylcytosine-specific restriction endonuclease McrA
MKKVIHDYFHQDRSSAATLRTIVLFGKNSSTYKFALTDTLLKQSATSTFSYEDLRTGFLTELYKHYIHNPHQYQSGANSITKAFQEYQINQDWDKLVDKTKNNIYRHVFDAFHNVGGSSIINEARFFEHDKANKQLVITEKFHQILENTNLVHQLLHENQTRWQIVEEAWKNKLSPNHLVYNQDQSIYSISQGNQRVALRSVVDVLLPYQHGRCFYCNKQLNPTAQHQDHDFPDVDHVIPHSMFDKVSELANINPNGLWNLVIACQECNRGSGGKFNSPPDTQFYKTLITRNKLFTEEHRHSLKNTILLSIGAKNSEEVTRRMNYFFGFFGIIRGWKPRGVWD